MKIIQDLKRNGLKTMKLPALALALAVGFTSCNDSKNDYPTPEISALAVFNAATDTEDVNFFLKDIKVNKELLALGDHVSYVEALAGTYDANIKTEKGESLLEDSIKFANQKIYSLFIVKENEELEIIKFDDDISSPTEGKAKIRFVHVSPNAGKLNFALVNKEEGQEEAVDYLFEDRDFKTATAFKEINAETQSFNVIDQVSGEVVFSLTDVKVKAGEVYTVWVKGLKGTEIEDQKIEAVVYKNR